MINKSIIKILNKDEIKQIPKIKTNLKRPQKLSPNVIIKLPKFLRKIKLVNFFVRIYNLFN